MIMFEQLNPGGSYVLVYYLCITLPVRKKNSVISIFCLLTAHHKLEKCLHVFLFITLKSH